MANQKFSEMVQKITSEMQRKPMKISLARSKVNGKKSFEEIFSFVWNLEDAQKILSPKLVTSSKSEKEANNHRKEGNNLYKNKKLNLALEHYNKSILKAPHPIPEKSSLTKEKKEDTILFPKAANSDDSTGEFRSLALGFANRSAVMFELKRYKKCIKDIEMAIEYGYPQDILSKLEERKRKCVSFLNEGVVDEDDQDKQSTADLPQLLSFLSIDDQPAETFATSQITSALEIAYKPSKGRCIIAKKDIKPGSIIGIEQACSVYLETDKLSLYCNTCVMMTNSPIPCPYCTTIIFCSNECQKIGLAGDHWIECKILPTLIEMDIYRRNLAVKMLKSRTYFELEALINDLNEENIEESGLVNLKIEDLQRSSFKAIHYLCSNKEEQMFEFLFVQAQISFILTKLLIQSERFFVDKDYEPFSPDKMDAIKTGAVILSNAIKLHCNPFQVFDLKRQDSLGAGVFPVFSLLNHSCYPSLRHFSVGHNLVVRAIRPIKAGEEITIAYTKEFHKEPIDERRKATGRYNFKCNCEACENGWDTFDVLPTMAFKCLDCKNLLSGKLQLCSNCKKEARNHEEEKANEHINTINMVFKSILEALTLNTHLLSGNIATKKDYDFICEAIEIAFNHMEMPSQHILILQNILFKCFEEGY